MNQDLQDLEIKVENEGTTPQGRLTATEWNILVAAVKSLDLTGGSVDITSILQAVADAGYATREWVNNQDYATTTDFNKFVKDFVTLNTTQAISGIKDFTNGLKVGGLSVYKSQADTIYLDANLVVRGGVTAFGTNETITASIFEALPIDGATLKRTENGVLYVDTTVVGGGGGTGGGISIADVENYLTTNGYATQSWVTGKGYITGITGVMVTNALGYTPYNSANFTKSNIKATLGISDWALASVKPTYTASEVGALGVNGTATNASKLGGFPPVYRPGENCIPTIDSAGVMEIGKYIDFHTLDEGDGVDYSLRIECQGAFRNRVYFPTTNGTLALTSNIPTKLSQLTDDVVAGKYLSLAGGTISQSAYWSTKFKSTGQTSSAIAFEVANGNVGYLMYSDGSKWQVTAQNWSATHTLLHSGNYSEYALPITGGTVNGDISLPNGNRLISPSGNIAGTRIFGDDTTNYRTILGTATLNTLLIGNSTLKFWKGAVSKEYEIIDTSMPSISFPKYIATGIGTTEQSGYKVKGNGVDATFGANDATGGAYLWVTSYHALRLATNGAERVRITPEGNVVLGGTTATEKLHVYGNILATGGITAQNSSDERLKRNIRKFNASKVLMSLRGVYEYEYIDSEVQKNSIYEGTHYGLIYQHVKGTALDVMCHEREDGMGALNYIHPKFISLIAGATMENISEVEKLKRKIRHLEQKVKQLEQRA